MKGDQIMKKYTALDLLFETTLRHVYTAEQDIAKELDTLIDNASSTRLKAAFHHHKTETERQIGRLERVCNILEINIHSTKLQGMPSITDQGKELLKTLIDMNFTDRSKGLEGILSEGRELLRHFGKTDANDVALASAGVKVENFEIACYSFICLLAEHYSQREIIDLMKTSLEEEMNMSEKLMDITREELRIPSSAI